MSKITIKDVTIEVGEGIEVEITPEGVVKLTAKEQTHIHYHWGQNGTIIPQVPYVNPPYIQPQTYPPWGTTICGGSGSASSAPCTNGFIH